MKTMKEEELRYIVRIIGTDVDGKKKLPYGLLKINSISSRLADAIVNVAGFNPEMCARRCLQLGGNVADDLEKTQGSKG